MAALPDPFRQYDEFARSMVPRWRPEDRVPRFGRHSPIHVVDISSTGEVRQSVLLIADFTSNRDPQYLVQLEAQREALKTEDGDIRTRLVLSSDVWTSRGFLYDLYGVEFAIKPAFFEAAMRSNQQSSWLLGEHIPTFLDLGRGYVAKFIGKDFDHPLTRKGVNISTAISAIPRQYTNWALVLIIIPPSDDSRQVHLSTLPHDIFVDLQFTEAPDILVDHELNTNEVSSVEQDATLNLRGLYTIMIKRWTNAERIDANEQPLKFLLPILELYVNQFQARASKYYDQFLHHENGDTAQASNFESLWMPLRTMMVAATWPFDAFKRYDSCYANGMVQKSSGLVELSSRFDSLQERVSKIEQHMRDGLQLQVGELSLQESKESIKQSKISVQESKRVKMRE